MGELSQKGNNDNKYDTKLRFICQEENMQKQTKTKH